MLRLPESLISVSAAFSAFCASVLASTAGFSSEIAWPRLAGLVPVIFAFSVSNGMSRLRETCAAATNWPRFLKPALAFCRSVPAGKSPWSRAVRFVFRVS